VVEVSPEGGGVLSADFSGKMGTAHRNRIASITRTCPGIAATGKREVAFYFATARKRIFLFPVAN